MAAGDAGDLYPAIEAFDHGWLEVEPPHVLYWEQSGRPDGLPVLFLHGGPGRPWPVAVRRLFDPARYRLVAFDQRGSWRSRPLGCLTNNTTAHLVADIERLRQSFGIESWFLFGGSWGSTLALAYALRHPERVRGMALWGIFLALAAENRWVNQTVRWLRPEACDRLVALVGESEPKHLLEAYRARLEDPRPEIRLQAYRVYEAHQDALSNIKSFDPAFWREEPTFEVALAELRIALTYFIEDCFLPEGHILDRAQRLAAIPGVIVHGEDDLLCPPSNAYDLHHAWPGSRLHMVPSAGHFAYEPGIRARLRATFDEFADG